jgi:hypothetical protein
MKASSRHLALASVVFRTLLRGNFREGVALRTTGTAEIPLPDDHPAAFLILLNIVHGHARTVPRQVDLRILTQIAILVDKYQFHEAAEMFTDSWFQSLKESIYQSPSDDLVAEICIYWVFGKSSEFQEVTRVAVRESTGKIDEKRLPIPSSIVGKN